MVERIFNPGPRHQHGAVLFVALVFLILITLLALTATGTSILQEKMTGGVRNRQLALMGAESGLRGGEAWFTKANFNGSNPLPQCGGSTADISGCAYAATEVSGGVGLNASVQNFRTSNRWVATAPGGAPVYPHTLTGLSGDAETASLHAQPLLVVEDLGAAGGKKFGRQAGDIDPEQLNSAWLYRITSRSQGGSGAVIRVTESVYSPGLNLGNAGANTP